MSNVIQFPKRGDDIVSTLKCLLLLAEEGAIVGLCGYALSSDERMVSITTDAVDNGGIAYCSIMLAKMVSDDSDSDFGSGS